VNDQWIGGSDRESPVQYFTFSPTLLHIGQENWITIKAETEGSRNPGLNIMPQLGAFLSDLPHAYGVINQDRIAFHTKMAMSTAISGLLFLVCLISWTLHPGNRIRAYQSAYLFGCFLYSMYYLGWFFSGEPYWVHIMFLALPLCICPIILMSGYFAESGDLVGEFFNNLLFIGFTLTIVISMAVFSPSPSQTMPRILNFYLFAVAYFIVTSTLLIHSLWKRRAMMAAAIALSFNIATTVLILAHLPKGDGWFMSPAVFLNVQIFQSFTFVFAIAIALTGVWDYSRKSKDSKRKQRTLEINRKLLSILVKSASFHDRLARIQRLACAHVGIEKSTIYLVDAKSEKLVLRAQSVIRNSEHGGSLAAEIIDPSPNGILGYVCQVRAPLMVQDLATDSRFSQYIETRKIDHFYTRSCMIFPLCAGPRLLAVITFSDKVRQESFTKSDFKFAAQVAHIAQVLCQLEMPEEPKPPARLVS
jgi:GAF domain